MSQPAMFDKVKAKAFTQKVLADTSGLSATILAMIGDQLGLFKDLATQGPSTCAELAERTQIHERYAQEWLAGMYSAGYLDYDPLDERFILPLEHVAVLAHEGSPVFFGGTHQMLFGMLAVLPQVMQAFRQGGGVPQAAYDQNMWVGLDRDSISWVEHELLQHWLAALPDVQAKLVHGAQVADVGCGRGRALIKLAQAFPQSRFTGYDVFEPTINQATALAYASGVGERVHFRAQDVSAGLPESYDLITTFDVVHDAHDPLQLLRAIRDALNPDGVYLCMDINCSDELAENHEPLDTLRYGFSLMYCLTTSLAGNGAGLGTMGLPASKFRQLCAEAGFTNVQVLTTPNAPSNVYAVK